MNIDGRKLLSRHSIPFFIRFAGTLVMPNIRTMRRLCFLAGHLPKAQGELKTDTVNATAFRFCSSHPVEGTL